MPPFLQLAPIFLETYLTFMVLLAIVMGLLFWRAYESLKSRRRAVFAAYDPAQLCMNSAVVGTVYRRLPDRETETHCTVVKIWKKNHKVTRAQPRSLPKSLLIPFDPERLFS